jgi:probable lipoprotein NlpC
MMLALMMALVAPTSCAEDSKQTVVEAPPTGANLLVDKALPWKDTIFRQGQGEQCMNWTREVLVAACGSKFATLQTDSPWDMEFLGADDEFSPEYVDSLASEEFGEKIEEINELEPGDLVFLRNTYGNWNEGVLTHVGIYVADGQYIHRMTSNKGYVRLEDVPSESFDSGLRLSEDLCGQAG